ncbi:MAG TPA: glutathione S-transferase family protein [Rhizomicrobium sp.]|nr:glutathione S-transferase family protein [Rhizomicrobium sp.]
MTYTLVLGNRNLSSWSLRPYLAMRAIGVAFEEVTVRLDRPETRAQIRDHSAAGKVPVLKIGEGGRALTVWDSLAICETLAERHPEAKLWPDDPAVRAVARSFAAEMHSGFPDLREQLPMDFARKLATPDMREATRNQVARILEAWSGALQQYGLDGGFLFGRFSIADCMYAPVVSRFATYGIAVPPIVGAYCERMMGLPAMQDWGAAAKNEIDAGWK